MEQLTPLAFFVFLLLFNFSIKLHVTHKLAFKKNKEHNYIELPSVHDIWEFKNFLSEAIKKLINYCTSEVLRNQIFHHYPINGNERVHIWGCIKVLYIQWFHFLYTEILVFLNNFLHKLNRGVKDWQIEWINLFLFHNSLYAYTIIFVICILKVLYVRLRSFMYNLIME